MQPHELETQTIISYDLKIKLRRFSTAENACYGIFQGIDLNYLRYLYIPTPYISLILRKDIELH